jgi:homopolymeric O-antigen transport system ATP-binding protein
LKEREELDYVVRATGIGKEYALGTSAVVTDTMRDALVAMFKKRSIGRREKFWALRDISFDVHEGEVVGIVGRNGAGKSTFLKILSRVTAPTEGEIRLRGRVGALLEVGTGFHTELSGRENIFMRGAALGMARSEIQKNFDAIVDFAGVEAFLDTPLKRYSSGMAVRLGFAVAAHLQPEILVVDEVLAVGDAEFQRKCLGLMNETARSGRTILFVSHNLSMVAQLCSRGVLLEKGRLMMEGPIDDVLEAYVSQHSVSGTTVFPDRPDLPAQITSIALVDKNGMPTTTVDWNSDIRIAIGVRAHQETPLAVKTEMRNIEGVRICQSVSADALKRYKQAKAGEDFHFIVTMEGGWLNPAGFTVRAAVLRDNATQYDAQFSDVWHVVASSESDNYFGQRVVNRTLLRLPLSWEEVDEPLAIQSSVQRTHD